VAYFPRPGGEVSLSRPGGVSQRLIRNKKQSNFARAAGFTLLEIMVTVGLIALTATFVGMSVSSSGSRMAGLEAERFVALINLAQDESILTGRPIVLQVDASLKQYSFLPMAPGAFSFVQPVDDEDEQNNAPPPLVDELLKTRSMPQGVELEFEKSEAPSRANSSSGLVVKRVHEIMSKSLFDDEQGALLQGPEDSEDVLIEPNGLISPFSLIFHQEKQQFKVELDRFGRAAVAKP